jgi:hypothetical protein
LPDEKISLFSSHLAPRSGLIRATLVAD